MHSTLKEIETAARKSPAYYLQDAILDFTGAVVQRMRQHDVTKAELAKRLKTSPAFVTKLLSGENNFTIETMVKVALALDTTVQIRFPDDAISTTPRPQRKSKAGEKPFGNGE